MKPALLITFLLAAFFIGVQKQETQHAQTVAAKQKADTIRDVRVQIVGLKQADQKKVAQAILKNPGILQLHFDNVDDARIRFDLAKITLKQVGDAIQRAGYTPYFH